MEDVQYFNNANWAALSGAFTPEQLREIAEEIESRYKAFKEGQEKTEG